MPPITSSSTSADHTTGISSDPRRLLGEESSGSPSDGTRRRKTRRAGQPGDQSTPSGPFPPSTTSSSDRDSSSGRSTLSVVGTVVGTAVVAYGTYRLVNWLYRRWPRWSPEQGNLPTTTDPLGTQEAPASIPTAPRTQYGPHGTHHHHQRHRWERIQRCREETDKALQSLLPTLRRVIEEATRTTTETRRLKQLRASTPPTTQVGQEEEEEQELWQIITTQALTRLLTTVYAQTLLFLVLTTQVHLLGGRLFQEQLLLSSSNPTGGGGAASAAAGEASSAASSSRHGSRASAWTQMDAYQSSHQQVLMHTYHYFLEQGLAALLETIERAVQDVMMAAAPGSDSAASSDPSSKWNVMQAESLHWTLDQWVLALNDMRYRIEYPTPPGRAAGRRATRPPRSLVRFLVPPPPSSGPPTAMTTTSPTEAPLVKDPLAWDIIQETWDLLSSPLFLDAQQECLQATFQALTPLHWQKLFVVSETSSPSPPSETATRPLATLVTQLSRVSSALYPSHVEVLRGGRLPATLAQWEVRPSVQELAEVSFG